MPSNRRGRGRSRRSANLLLLIPCAAALFVPSYNMLEPELAGIPFFYWYQLLWIVIGAVVLYVVYRMGEQAAGPRD